MDTTIKKPDPIRNYISNGASKKSLCYLVIVLVVALLVFAGLWYYLSRAPKIEEVEERPTEKSMKEILEGLGTPGQEGREVSEEVFKKLGAPNKEGREVPKDVLESLGVPK